jgi:predicted acyl esterase
MRTPAKISGEPIVDLAASTSGTDYPDEVSCQPVLGGYQLMVSADIFRDRYRKSLENPKSIAPDRPLLYRFALRTANHVFLPGHRVMVQAQSSWFPLYEPNPQTLVPNRPQDYRKPVQRIYHAPGPGELR